MEPEESSLNPTWLPTSYGIMGKFSMYLLPASWGSYSQPRFIDGETEIQSCSFDPHHGTNSLQNEGSDFVFFFFFTGAQK